MITTRRVGMIVGLVVVGMLAASMAFAATVKKKNGQVVTGEIKNLIVQKGSISRSSADGKTTYTANYQLVNGAEASSIDEEGVHWTTNRVYFFSVSQEGTPLDDLDVIETGVNTPPGSIFGGYTKGGGLVVAIGGRTQRAGGTCSDRLLGEFRVDPTTRKGQIIAALELSTAGGMAKIPVAEIVAFRRTESEAKVDLTDGAPSTTKAKPGATRSISAVSDGTGKETQPSSAAPAHRQRVTVLTITPDGRLLASASFDGTIKLWSLPQGRLLRSLSGHKSGVYSMAMSADGKSLISGSHEDSIIVWSLPGGEIVKKLDNEADGSMTAMATTPAGKVLAAGTFTATLTLWSLPEGQLLKTIRAAHGINALALTPDGSTVAGGSFGPIELWSVPEGNPIGSLKVDRESVKVLAVTPDGGILVSASENSNTIRLWSLAERKLVAELKSKSKEVGSLAVTSDGKTLAAGGADGVLEFWSLPDGAPLSAMPGHKDMVCALAFSSDGSLLASGDEKGAINLWDFKKKTLVRSLSAR